MRIEEIEAFIKPNGEVSYEVRGVKGRKCLDITKEMELELGGEVMEREETSEMYEAQTTEVVEEREVKSELK